MDEWGVQLMRFTPDTRVVTTAELVELNNRATDFGATRVLDQYEMLNLDQGGLHFLTHIHIVWTPFYRCEVALKVDSDPFPHFAVLDLNDEWYLPLLRLEDYIKALDYYRTHPRRGDEIKATAASTPTGDPDVRPACPDGGGPGGETAGSGRVHGGGGDQGQPEDARP